MLVHPSSPIIAPGATNMMAPRQGPVTTVWARWNNLSIQWKFQVLVQVVLIAILLSAQSWLEGQFKRHTMLAAETRAATIADDVINSLNTLMLVKVRGEDVIGDKKSRALFLRRMGGSDELQEVRVVRGKGVLAEFDEGLPEEQPRDDLDRAVMASGKPEYRQVVGKDGGPALRAVIPYIAKSNMRGVNCMNCHGVAENEVLGATSVTIGIKDDIAAIERMVRILWGGQVAVQVLLFFIIGMVMKKAIANPLRDQVLPAFGALSEGKYDTVLDTGRNDEIGKVLQGLDAMQKRIGTEVAATKRRADEMTRIKIALDNVSTPVRIADAAGTVIYINQTLRDTLLRIEPNLKAQNPAFGVATFVGSSIGNLYADPAAALKRLAGLAATTDTVMDIGGRTYRVVTSPVFGAGGERLGSVGEWQERTEQLAVEREVAGIVDRARAGDLAGRIDTGDKEGFFAALAQGINGLLETTQQALQATSSVLSRVARGDLSQTIDTDYTGIFGQLKDDTNATIERLREVVGRIKEASETINTAAQEIAAGNQDLSNRTEEQASSLEETASSMEELNATVKQNAENARQANELAHSSNEIASRGGAMVKRVVSTMSDIQESSRKIADIVGVIDSIAFQTNILALNAAVEAARAGEQGRGFAVVATEVRNLAQRSATAAKEIKGLIAASVDQIEGGATLVQEAGSTMDEVVNSFQRVAELVTDITAASREQSSGIEQVARAVSQMDEVTQQNAALVEEAAAGAASLEEQAQGLVRAVGTFKLAAMAPEPPPQLRPAPVPSRAPALRTIAPPHRADDDKDEWAEF